MRNICLALPVFAACAFSAPAFGACPICPVDDIYVSFTDTNPASLDDVPRREFATISSALATELGIGSVAGTSTSPNPQIRVRIQDAPLGSGIDVNNAVFTVVRIKSDSDKRIWVHRRKDASDAEAGEFKLFALPDDDELEVYETEDDNDDEIIDGVLLEAYRIPVSSSAFTTTGVYSPTLYYAEPSASKSYVEKAYRRLGDDRVVAMAPHGGNIETNTSTQLNIFADKLEDVSGTLANIWNLEGRWGNDQTDERWHITAPSIDIASYPGLSALLPADDQFDRAVSFHGFAGTPTRTCGGGATPFYEIILGGSAELNFKCFVAWEIRQQTTLIAINIRNADEDDNIELPDNCSRYVTATGREGTDADNIVNRVAEEGGIQLEQSKSIRDSATLRTDVAEGAALAFGLYDLWYWLDFCGAL